MRRGRVTRREGGERRKPLEIGTQPGEGERNQTWAKGRKTEH